MFFIYSRNITTKLPFLVWDMADSRTDAEALILLDVLRHRCSDVRYQISEEKSK